MKCQAGWITSWNQDSWGKYQQSQICRWYHFNGRNEEELKSLLMKVKEESEKADLKLNIQKTKIMASSPISSVQSLSRVQLFATPWIAARQPPCPSPSPGVHSNSCSSSWWYHPAISSSVVLFSFSPQSLPASESFPMSQLFAVGGQSTGG